MHRLLTTIKATAESTSAGSYTAILERAILTQRDRQAVSRRFSWLRRYIAAVFRMPSHLPSEQKLERCLSNLARARDVSASTQNQAFDALLYFYRDVSGRTLGNVNTLCAQRPVHGRRAPNRGGDPIARSDGKSPGKSSLTAASARQRNNQIEGFELVSHFRTPNILSSVDASALAPSPNGLAVYLNAGIVVSVVEVLMRQRCPRGGIGRRARFRF